MKIAAGVDLIKIDRLRRVIQRHGERFLQRVYTPSELQEIGQHIPSLAARFAAKEAVAKALGTGIGTITWQEIEILRGPQREPILHLHGNAKQRAEQLGLETWSLSLSHSESDALAFVIAIGQ
jgi:holo-[acyl-carrier protein] synthase